MNYANKVSKTENDLAILLGNKLTLNLSDDELKLLLDYIDDRMTFAYRDGLAEVYNFCKDVCELEDIGEVTQFIEHRLG